MLNDPLSNAMSKILNAEKIGRSSVTLKPVSSIIKEVLTVMKTNGYVGDFKEIECIRGNMIELNLLGQINKCGAIKPRFPVKQSNYEKFEKRYLPAKDFGILIVSTPKGVMTQSESINKKTGGSLLAYCY